MYYSYSLILESLVSLNSDTLNNVTIRIERFFYSIVPKQNILSKINK